MAEKWERQYVIRLLSDGLIFSIDGALPDCTKWIEFYDFQLGEQGWKLEFVNETTVDGAKAMEHIYQRKVEEPKTTT